MRVDITAPARDDLLEIGLFIARDNLERALTFSAELEQASLKLGDYPKRFPVCIKLDDYEIRKRVFRDYLILYRVDTEAVRVLRVLQGAVDLDRILDELGQ